ncbi:histidine phosphatase family protein [Sporosarcina sp. HYO08]|uniref:histidine phosphatase family protein n=1 Tax=Sporosarcina sp. HYO08 TaxID=1759557 RepID=UPI0007962F44|nr:histidine phosphatase family protein [Sporosarcina sp. HYO08]KXH87032.1 phosphoglycerate kinase [Sporosarcina sp. HYO08]
MTIVGFVRHGVTGWNKEGREQGRIDIPLDDEGIEMAERVAKRLADQRWDVIFTSPLIRAKKTAEIIAAKKPELPLHVDDRLCETSGGFIEGTTEAERIAKWGAAWRKLDLGREPSDKMIARGMEFIEEINRMYSTQRVLIVSHGSYIGKLVKALLPDGNFEEELQNTSLTIVHMKRDRNFCALYNCTKHLRL